MKRKISVIGLGYVGLPVAVAFAKLNPVIGYDRNVSRINNLIKGFDATGEISLQELTACNIRFATDPSELKNADFHIIAVPTPIDNAKQPDLSMLKSASETVGKQLKKGDIVVYESTVYPGVTEEVCLPILEACSKLRCPQDFSIGYSPERINPGDKAHSFELITKVVSGYDTETLEIIAETYGRVVKAGIHRAQSIKIAEAAKVIENTQRDLNIALMNELAMLFSRMQIDTTEVLNAANTKWNFLPFRPGLVGGHCIGVDPYYLTHKAEQLNYHPQVILAGRRINDSMAGFITEQIIKKMIGAGNSIKNSKIAVLGVTFKENCPDIRNSKVFDIIAELKSYGVNVIVSDPFADPEEVFHEYKIELSRWEDFKELDGILIAVAHDSYRKVEPAIYLNKLSSKGYLFDIKSIIDINKLEKRINYWRL